RYLIASNRILYSTRIQMFIVAAVVFTLVVAGGITFWSVSNQFRKQQERTILKNSWDISKAFESRLIQRNSTIGMDDYVEFQAIAEANALDLNLYDVDGHLMYTTQPRIYDLELISDYINPRALDHLRYYGRSQYVQAESIGQMKYVSAYTSILNTAFEPIAFLSLPYYASQVELERSTGGLLNALINIYALVILILGLFAVFVANKITAPLLLVQKSLAKTKIGKHNEPIFWKRDDEMGRLIKEYNLMIAELEESAERIVQSERESAWKEMARQVAHEIRNPLTPLKLGMQQLERSWLDKDPDFETRFKRFIGSFIEQIDGLTRIATEFSDFARMPDSEFSDLDLSEILRHSVAVFNNYTNVNIELQFAENLTSTHVRGNKDQLMSTFNNLIKNAIEATTNLRRCQIRILVTGNEQLLRISIQDNGEGIAPDVRKKLFEPNFTTKSSGTGLGLAFVKRAVENMGGEISYKTTVGKGSTFLIILPRVRDTEED
ncbi:MAG TPA: HAMP domain-containing sensor histidine kinase, partial [Sphingobacteriaceae bacterium]|nr:HAMP domain-containing sensor histidine kinase [Sphingobacteriaceae bacterium]